MRNKYKGVTLSATAIAIIAWMFLGYISFIVMASPFSILASARTARQAEQYAEFVASSLKLVDYSELSTASHARQSLTGEIAGAVGWESRVEIGAEQQIGSNPDNLQRIATIDIFQTGDTLSRYTLQVPLSSSGYGSSFGAPDWSKGYGIDITHFTAPSNGWIYYAMNSIRGKCVYFLINGHQAYWFEPCEGDDANGYGSFIPVSKGDKITGYFVEHINFSYVPTNYIYPVEATFYPCKKK